MLTSLLIGTALLIPRAEAGKCDTYASRLSSSSGQSLISNYSRLVSCDKALAESRFEHAMTRATDADTLSGLSLVAIESEIWTPVWSMLGKISSYEARDEVAGQVGSACGETPSVVTFLQGGYAGLRDIDFQQWDDALLSCDSPALDTWLTQQIENPPSKLFDSKYDLLVDVFIKKKGAAALPHLATGAIKAAEDGPYDKMLESMNAAVTPRLGGEISDEDAVVLQENLVAVASAVAPDKARRVADTLVQSGATDAAISLLPAIYPDQVHSDGSFLYGVAAIESGTCKGTLTAVVHYAEVSEPGKRWDIQDEVEEPIRASKPRLKKCTPDDGEWMVRTTIEPLASSAELSDWVEGIEAQWAGKDYEVSTRSESAISLP